MAFGVINQDGFYDTDHVVDVSPNDKQIRTTSDVSKRSQIGQRRPRFDHLICLYTNYRDGTWELLKLPLCLKTVGEVLRYNKN